MVTNYTTKDTFSLNETVTTLWGPVEKEQVSFTESSLVKVLSQDKPTFQLNEAVTTVVRRFLHVTETLDFSDKTSGTMWANIHEYMSLQELYDLQRNSNHYNRTK